MTAVDSHASGAFDPTPTGVDASTEVTVVVSPFAGFGRLAHLRRELLGIGAVRGVRIQGYGAGEARFVVDLHPHGVPTDLQLPGTRIRSIVDATVSLAVIGSVAAS